MKAWFARRYLDLLGMLENHGAVIAVYGAIGLPLTTWLLKAGFDRILPQIEDAARLDGYSRPEIMALITLPLAAPTLARAHQVQVALHGLAVVAELAAGQGQPHATSYKPQAGGGKRSPPRL